MKIDHPQRLQFGQRTKPMRRAHLVTEPTRRTKRFWNQDRHDREEAEAPYLRRQMPPREGHPQWIDPCPDRSDTAHLGTVLQKRSFHRRRRIILRPSKGLCFWQNWMLRKDRLPHPRAATILGYSVVLGAVRPLVA